MLGAVLRDSLAVNQIPLAVRCESHNVTVINIQP